MTAAEYAAIMQLVNQHAAQTAVLFDSFDEEPPEPGFENAEEYSDELNSQYFLD